MALTGFTIDIMLPGFSQIALELDAPMQRVQESISIFALCFGFAQIIYGPASDKYGRRPIIAIGMGIFIIGAIISMFAQDIATLLIGRGLQGFGGAAAPVLARALLRDTHSGTELAMAMATSMAIFSFGPIVAPLLGIFIIDSFNWRVVFVFICAFAFILLLFDIYILKETNRNKNPNALKPRVIWSSISTIVRHPQSRYFILCASIAYCALFSYISNSPVIYESAFGVTGFAFAAMFAFTGLGIIIGQMVNRALLPKLGVMKMLRVSSFILLIASVGVGLLSYLELLNAYNFTALMFFFNTSFLAVISNTASLTIDPHPNLAGITSAFYGGVTNGIAAVFIAATFALIGGDIQIWAWVMMATTGLTVLALWAVKPSSIEFSK